MQLLPRSLVFIIMHLVFIGGAVVVAMLNSDTVPIIAALK